MTYESIRLSQLSDDENATVNRLLKELEDRTDRNLLRASYYDGKHAIRAVGSIIPPQYFKLGIVLGWSAKAVDLLARRCTLDNFVWADGDLDSIGGRDVWDDNHLGSEVSSGLTSSLIHGPSFLINTTGDESENEPDALIHTKDATSGTGTWNARRRGLDDFISVTARKDNKVTGFALYLHGLTIVARKDGDTWEVDRVEHNFGMPVEVMPYKPTVRHPFGKSRITRPIMAMQDRATMSVVRLEAHSDIYSIPDLWMFGADESIFKNADGSQRAAWQVMMGRLKAIPDNIEAEQANERADVKQFPASSPQPNLATLNAQAKMFAREASLPDTAVAITDVSNPTSAESYDASQYELIAEAEGATSEWTPGLRRSFIRALAMKNDLSSVPEQWKSIDAKWRDPRYLAKSAQADAGLKQLTAMPWLAETSVGLELIGLDEQQARRAMAEKRRADATQRLKLLAEAARTTPAPATA